MKTRFLLMVSMCAFCLISFASPKPLERISLKGHTNALSVAAIPSFVGGAVQQLTVCENSGISFIDSLLGIIDADAGKNLTISVVSAASNGTVHGFPATVQSNGGLVSPTGFDYSPKADFFGTDAFTIQVSDGVSVSTTVIKVAVNQVAKISPITGKVDLCAGNTTLLKDASAGGIWSSNNGAVATIDINGNVTTIAAGKSTISYTINNNNGCYSVATDTLNVTGYPIVPAITGSSNTVCEGATLQYFNTTPSGVWTSSSPANATVDSATGVITGVVGSAAGVVVTITYVVTNAGGCATSVNRNVRVYASPVLTPTISPRDSVCVSSTVRLTNTSGTGTGVTIAWLSSDATIATVNNGLVTGVAAGTANILYRATNNRGCSTTETTPMSVFANPTVLPITGASSICLSTTTNFTDATPNGNWTSGDVRLATVNFVTGAVTPVRAGIVAINYRVTNATGCSTLATTNLTILSGPTVPAISGSSSTCVGSTDTLSDLVPNGVWASSIPTVAKIDANGVVTAVGLGNSNISYTVTNSSGCTTTVNQVLNVSTGLTIAPITGANSLCSGNATVVRDATTGGVWSILDTTIATIDTLGVVRGVAGGTTQIVYTVSSGGSCSGIQTFPLTVYQTPVLGPITGPTAVCVGSAVQLSNLYTGGYWTSSDNSIATVNGSGLVTGVASSANNISITYTATSANGCPNSTSVPFNVNGVPVVSSITGAGGTASIASNSLCTGSSLTYTEGSLGGTWSSSSPSVAIISNVTTKSNVSYATILPIKTGITEIDYKITNGNGCSTTQTILLTVSDSIAVANITGVTSYCLNRYTDSLHDSTSNGRWFSSNTAIVSINATSGLITPRAVGSSFISYTVTSGGCQGTKTVAVTVNAPPTVPTIKIVSGGIAGNPPSLCSGSSMIFGSSTTGGVWTSQNINVATIDSVTGLTTGFYNTGGNSININYVVTNAFGCKATATQALKVINTAGSFNITGLNRICVGDQVPLKVTTTGGTWSVNNPAIATIDTATGVLTALSSGVVDITYTVTTGGQCPSTAIRTENINPLPVVDQISGNVPLCVGASNVLFDTIPLGVWTSDNTSVATIDAGLGIVTGVASGTANISYTVTNTISAHACSTTVSQPVVINALPVVPPILGNTSVCVGGVYQLSDALTGGKWVSYNPTVVKIDSITGKINALAVGSATIHYIYSNISGCADSTSSTITVNGLPIVAAITGSYPLCVGKSLTLSDTTNGGYWTSISPSIATIDSTGAVTAVNSGLAKFSYTATNIYGCKNAVTDSFVINPLPVLGTITGAVSICTGSSSTLSDSSINGKWYSSNVNVATIDSVLGNVNALNKGNVTITFSKTDNNGCFNSTTTLITVKPLPVIAPFVGNTNVCLGSKTTIVDTTSGGVFTINAPSIAPIVSSNATSATILGMDTGSATLTYSVTLNGCQDSINTSIVVNPLPINTPVLGNTSFCVGKTSQLSNDSTQGVWYSTNTGVADINGSGLVTGLSSGTTVIGYILSNQFGCTDTSTTIVSVNPIPTVLPITGSSALCLNKTLSLSEATANGTYTNSNPSVLSLTASGSNASLTAIALGSSVVTYTVTNSFGCTDSVTKTIGVNPLPTIAPISGNTPVCSGSTITVSSNPNNGSWSTSDSTIATINTSTGLLTGIKGGTTNIKYIVITPFGCSDSVFASEIVKQSTSSILKATICEGDSILFNGTYYSKAGSYIYNTTNSNLCDSTVTLNLTVNKKTSSVTTQTICFGSSYVFNGTSYNQTGTYTYHTPNAAGCDSAAILVLTVAQPQVIAPIAGSSSICLNSAALLTDTTIGGIYLSSNPSILSIKAVGNNLSVSALSVGTTVVTYKVTNAFGCTDSVTKTITVNALPTITQITGNTPVCVGSGITVSSTPSNGTWSTSNPTIATITPTGLLTGINGGSTTIKYVVKNSNGCSDSVFATQIVKSPSSSTNNASICEGDSILFNGTYYYQGGIYTYHLLNSNGCDSAATLNLTLKSKTSSLTQQTICPGGSYTFNGSTYTKAGTYTIHTINSAGCDSAATLLLTVSTSPTAPVITTNSPIYTGDSLKVSVPVVSGANYSWSGPSGFFSATPSNSLGNANKSNSGNYSVSYTLNGCVSQIATVFVRVYDSVLISGHITNPMNLPVGRVTISTNYQDTNLTDVNGAYGFVLKADSTYSIIPYKNNDSVVTDGIDVVDILKVQNNILGKTPFTLPDQLIAADVNGDSAIDVIDILKIKRLILGIDTTFSTPSGNRLWGFVDSAYVFPDSMNIYPFPDHLTIPSVSKSYANKSLTAIKLGDVDFSWDGLSSFTHYKTFAVAQRPLELYYNPIVTKIETDTVIVPIRVNNFNSIKGVQFTLGFNSNAFQFVGVEQKAIPLEFGSNHVSEGALTAIWADSKSEARSLTDSTILFNLILVKHGEIGLEDLTVNSKYTKSIAYNENLEPVGIIKTNGSIKDRAIGQEPTITASYELFPNPNNGNFSLNIISPTSTSSMVEIQDVFGKTVFQKKLMLEKGSNTFKLNILQSSKLPSGNYYLNLSANQYFKTQPFIINK